MQVKSKLKEYVVEQETTLDFFEGLVQMENAQFVIDKNVYKIYQEFFAKIQIEHLTIIEALEENKVIETVLNICEKMTEIPAKRNAKLIAVGGGIIQDLAGFAANIIYRGIQWYFVPTTLLAASDSCIGGKTSVNYKKYKNLLGTFYPPDKIYICPVFFGSLSEHDFKSGLGEVIKFNIMEGEAGLESIEQNIDKLLNRESDVVHEFVKTSLEFKKKFIEIDEFDRGERIKLNFAHTFGHAIEVITDYEIPHGTAVAIGMIMADYISYRRNFLSKDIMNRSERVLLKVIDIKLELLKQPLEMYIKVIKKDKKQIDNALTCVLITNYGSISELSVVHDLAESEIGAAINYFISLYKMKG